MIKRIFTWFFCNLYYFYAKKKSKNADFVIVSYIGGFMAWPVMFIALIVVWVFNDFQLDKGLGWLTLIVVNIPLYILFNRIFYKSKRYLKLLKKFPEEKYNKYIFFYTILFFLILPGGMMIVIMKLFS